MATLAIVGQRTNTRKSGQANPGFPTYFPELIQFLFSV